LSDPRQLLSRIEQAVHGLLLAACQGSKSPFCQMFWYLLSSAPSPSPLRSLRRLIESAQFTSADFTGVLLDAKVAISMDGKGAWRDNVFVERLWRSVKYEEVYLHAYDSVSEARASIARYLTLYNARRPHSSLDGRTPDEAYFAKRAMVIAA
jgi:putative transposase